MAACPFRSGNIHIRFPLKRKGDLPWKTLSTNPSEMTGGSRAREGDSGGSADCHFVKRRAQAMIEDYRSRYSGFEATREEAGRLVEELIKSRVPSRST